MNSRIIVLAAAVVVILAAGVFLLTQNNATSNENATVNTSTAPTDAMMEDDAMAPTDAMMEESSESGEAMMEEGAMTDEDDTVKEITVTASNFKFLPATITVNKGDTVKVIFKNTGGNHDFVIDEFDARTNVIGSGKEETIEFVANKSGTYEYYCSVGTHRQMGMVGKLIVK